MWHKDVFLKQNLKSWSTVNQTANTFKIKIQKFKHILQLPAVIIEKHRFFGACNWEAQENQ